MNRSIFTRGVHNHLENWSMHVREGDRSWRSLMQSATTRLTSDTSMKMYRWVGSNERKFYELAGEEVQHYARLVGCMGQVTGSPKHLSLYLTLL